MINLSPTLKGVVTGLLMIAVSIAIYARFGNFEGQLIFISYLLYIGGIAWTLIAYSRMEVLKTFKTYFTQGFKCFITVTFLMVIFTFGFLKMTPGMKEEMAQNYRTELINQGDKTPAEIETMVLKAKEYYITQQTSLTIFFYLFAGTVVTVIISMILMSVRKGHQHQRTINT
ncbi:MAG: DUF4199 domain-containing protein [Chitinophagaceae bacterium]|nr:MAG: DUF4199 domain-containing protein [Chitinophagaceae bacterium]